VRPHAWILQPDRKASQLIAFAIFLVNGSVAADNHAVVALRAGALKKIQHD